MRCCVEVTGWGELRLLVRVCVEAVRSCASPGVGRYPSGTKTPPGRVQVVEWSLRHTTIKSRSGVVVESRGGHPGAHDGGRRWRVRRRLRQGSEGSGVPRCQRWASLGSNHTTTHQRRTAEKQRPPRWKRAGPGPSGAVTPPTQVNEIRRIWNLTGGLWKWLWTLSTHQPHAPCGRLPLHQFHRCSGCRVHC